ncbi:MAG: hypothetical protein M3Z18_06645 [Gemmatimonadota bacterium]|nr:hypothetical protein [Gemmatimonadota bacterium]
MPILAVLSAALGLFAAGPLAGQACTANGSPASCNRTRSVSMTAGRVVRLQVSTAATTLTPPTPTDFDNGFNATTGPTFTVSANAAWTLYMRAQTVYWAAVNTSPGAPARTTKPAGDLKWSKTSNGTFNALTTSDVTLASGTATASNVTSLFFQTLYNWTLDTPGNYSLTVVLTLTSP